MRIIAIDPGSTHSAYVVYDAGKVLHKNIILNDDFLIVLGQANYPCDEMAIEMIASYGMPVGKTVFDTCVWIGRFIERWSPKPARKVYRGMVKMHLCQSMRAKDGNIRRALLDMYPATGGGKTPQIGTKNQPGPLYGVSGDVWAALAVAVTFDQRYSEIVEKQE